MIKIAVDGMGGDFAPKEIVEGIKLALDENADISIVVTGDKNQLEQEFENYTNKSRVEIIHTEEVITMHDKPREALLRKKNSSMYKAVELVKEKYVDGMVTAGNSGAHMAISLFTLGRLAHVTRPAIGVVVPFIDGNHGLLLDVGASVDIGPKEYLVFAILGKTYFHTLFKKEDIKVGLLNIGAEEEKGTKVLQEAHKLLKENLKEFSGNIEPHEALYHKVDVIVTDGFTGNILEKSYEGAGQFIVDTLKKEIAKSFKYKIGALLMQGAMKNTMNTLNYESFGGSPLLGVDGLSIKAHGRSKRGAIKNAIKVCYDLAKDRLIDEFKNELEKMADMI